MSNNKIYDSIVEHEWQERTAEDLLPDLRALTVKQYIDKTIVNNFIVANNLNLKLRAIANTPYTENGTYDTPIPAAGGLTVRLAAQAGLDWLVTDSGAQVNPDNPNLNALIGLLQSVGVFTAQEVADFWALFEKPLFPELDTDDEAALAIVRGALNTPKAEQTEMVLAGAWTLHQSLMDAENARQSQRTNYLAAVQAAKDELASGLEREVPDAPSGEAWE